MIDWLIFIILTVAVSGGLLVLGVFLLSTIMLPFEELMNWLDKKIK